MGDTGFINNKYSCKGVVSKGSINVWSKCANVSFHMIFVLYVSAAKYVSPSLLFIPGKRFIRYVIQGCDIEGSNIATEPIFLSILLYS